MILFFDTETTGFWADKLPVDHPQQCRVVQIGALMVDDQAEGRPEVARLDTIIYQPYDVPEVAANIHKVTTERCQRYGVNEEAAMEVFFDMVDMADMIVAHNYQFDSKVLRGTFGRLAATKQGIDATQLMLPQTTDVFAGKPYYCTMLNSVDVCKIPNKNRYRGYSWPKLEEAMRRLLGREPTNAHNAIGDVIDCKDLFFYLQDLELEQAYKDSLDPAEQA